jgi:zinc transporter ZupT
MDAPNKPARTNRSRGMAGGSLLAISMVIGAVAGTYYGQPSIGFLLGLAVGALFVLLVWLLDRR